MDICPPNYSPDFGTIKEIMNPLTIHLIGIERRLRGLVEGSVARLFPIKAMANELLSNLMQAMQDSMHQTGDGKYLAPNLYTVLLPPDQAEVLQRQGELIEDLGNSLLEMAEESELTFSSPPVVRIVASPELSEGQMRVEVINSLENLPQTTDLYLQIDAEQDSIPRAAYLIVDGTQVFPLEQTVINIGRRSDNQLVIDDRRVSRVHAQLRALRGRFVIFDLDSIGGTWVNGRRIRQQPLCPGDVISLSGIPLVFGQDPANQSETQDIPVKPS